MLSISEFLVCVCVCVCVCVSLCVCLYWGGSVCCLFTSFLSVLFVFHWKNLILLHLIGRYMTSTSESFLKRKDIPESKFLIFSELLFLCNTDTCSYQTTGGVNIYLCGCMGLSFSWSQYVLCVFVCRCDIRSEYQH